MYGTLLDFLLIIQSAWNMLIKVKLFFTLARRVSDQSCQEAL